jgi:hypothetical protein
VDLVFAATAWHWVDPAVRYRKAAELTRAGGHLGVVTTDHVVPADGDPFFVAVQRVYEELDETNGDDVPRPPEAMPDPLSDEIERSGLFGRPAVRQYVWEQPYTVDQYLALLDTYSNHIAMEPAKRAHLDESIRRLANGRPIRKHYLNWLHVARRRDEPA